MKRHVSWLSALALLLANIVQAADLPKVSKVELQPLAAQAARVAAALELLGAPLSAADRQTLKDAKDVAAIQGVLDRHCLAGVRIPEDSSKGAVSAMSVEAGPAKPELAEQGWRVFLVKVYNPGGMSGLGTGGATRLAARRAAPTANMGMASGTAAATTAASPAAVTGSSGRLRVRRAMRPSTVLPTRLDTSI